MGCWNHNGMGRWQNKGDSMRSGINWWGTRPPSSGNRAFDEYRADTLRRLAESDAELARGEEVTEAELAETIRSRSAHE